MNPPTPFISVVTPVSLAFERTRQILFQPFDFYRWLCIGFTAWLATLGENWGGGGGGGGGGRGTNPRAFGIRESWENARAYVIENFSWILPVTLLVIFAIIGITLLILWLSSRGRFMFVHNVALNRADVVAPWHDYARHGNSLFLFRLIVAFIGFVLIVPFLALAIAAAISMINAEAISWGPMAVAIGSTSGALLIGLGLALVDKLTKDFVVPIMWMRQPSCRAAWTEFLPLLRSNLLEFVLYILFHILLTVAAGILVLAVVLVTCCIAGCLFALPYLGTVLMLPVFVFFRSFSLLYLAQYGPDYNAFQAPFLPPDPGGPNPAGVA